MSITSLTRPGVPFGVAVGIRIRERRTACPPFALIVSSFVSPTSPERSSLARSRRHPRRHCEQPPRHEGRLADSLRSRIAWFPKGEDELGRWRNALLDTWERIGIYSGSSRKRK